MILFVKHIVGGSVVGKLLVTILYVTEVVVFEAFLWK